MSPKFQYNTSLKYIAFGGHASPDYSNQSSLTFYIRMAGLRIELLHNAEILLQHRAALLPVPVRMDDVS